MKSHQCYYREDPLASSTDVGTAPHPLDFGRNVDPGTLDDGRVQLGVSHRQLRPRPTPLQPWLPPEFPGVAENIVTTPRVTTGSLGSGTRPGRLWGLRDCSLPTPPSIQRAVDHLLPLEPDRVPKLTDSVSGRSVTFYRSVPCALLVSVYRGVPSWVVYLWAFLGIGLSIGAWSLATPLGSAPDEPTQMLQGVAIVRGHFDGRQVPLTYAGIPVGRIGLIEGPGVAMMFRT